MKTGKIIGLAAGILICLLALFFVNWKNSPSPLSIDANGNVGIGTEEPKAKFHVAGDVGVNGAIVLGINQQGRQNEAGTISYGKYDNGALCIVGAGTEVNNRRITLWSEGGAQLRGSLSINKESPPTAALDVNGRIKDQTGYVVPVGGIIMYTGNSADLFDAEGKGKQNTPVQGWALCNGKNNTPNLINRFIVGCGPGSAYGPNTGTTGGEASHMITVSEMPSHSHTYVKGGWWGGGNEGAHTGSSWGNNSNRELTTATGNNIPMPILPPYYALFYIMKL